MSSDNRIMQTIAEQYNAAFEMLEELIVNCDDELWQDPTSEPIINQVVYHVIFGMDFYLSKTKAEAEAFQGKYGPPSNNFQDQNTLFTKEQLTTYLKEVKIKTDYQIKGLTIQELNEPIPVGLHPIGNNSILYILLHELRHIMHHIGALHVRINRSGNTPLRWIVNAPN